MVRKETRRFAGRQRLVAAVILGISILIPRIANAQAQIPVELEPAKIVEGDVFELRMEVADVTPNQVLPMNLKAPEGLRLVEAYVEKVNSPKLVSRFVVRIRALRSGFYEMPALRVTAAGREISSGAVLIQVHPASGGDIPLEAHWHVENNGLIAGQSLLAVVRLQSPDTPV
ncbi:MAG: hypothetical protein D6B26_07155, partial [Spirochaetaceae bacterium]